MEHISDSEIVPELVERIVPAQKVASWSFDKGFWHKDNKALLSQVVENLVLPKKGKCNKAQAEEKKSPCSKNCAISTAPWSQILMNWKTEV